MQFLSFYLFFAAFVYTQQSFFVCIAKYYICIYIYNTGCFLFNWKRREQKNNNNWLSKYKKLACRICGGQKVFFFKIYLCSIVTYLCIYIPERYFFSHTNVYVTNFFFVYWRRIIQCQKWFNGILKMYGVFSSLKLSRISHNLKWANSVSC